MKNFNLGHGILHFPLKLPWAPPGFVNIYLIEDDNGYIMIDCGVNGDEYFDELCKSINPALTTGNAKLDIFFQDCFSADTGMWIHKHPEKDKLKNICSNYFS